MNCYIRPGLACFFFAKHVGGGAPRRALIGVSAVRRLFSITMLYIASVQGEVFRVTRCPLLGGLQYKGEVYSALSAIIMVGVRYIILYK